MNIIFLNLKTQFKIKKVKKRRVLFNKYRKLRFTKLKF